MALWIIDDVPSGDIKKTPCKAKLPPLLCSGQTLPCCGALHTMQCNAALLMQLCMTHYRGAVALCCGFVSSVHFVSPASCLYSFFTHFKKKYRWRRLRDWANTRLILAFFRKFPSTMGIPVTLKQTQEGPGFFLMNLVALLFSVRLFKKVINCFLKLNEEKGSEADRN